MSTQSIQDAILALPRGWSVRITTFTTDQWPSVQVELFRMVDRGDHMDHQKVTHSACMDDERAAWVTALTDAAESAREWENKA